MFIYKLISDSTVAIVSRVKFPTSLQLQLSITDYLDGKSLHTYSKTSQFNWVVSISYDPWVRNMLIGNTQNYCELFQ